MTDPFSPEQARALLRHYLNPTRASEADLSRLLERLGRRPLTLELAGHWFAAFPDLDVDTYLKKFDIIPFYPQFSRWLEEVGPVDDAAPMIAFAINWSKVRSKQALWLLAVAAFCAPDRPIPVELLRRALCLHLARPWGCLDVIRLKLLRLKPRVDLGKALGDLLDLGLLKLRDGGGGPHAVSAAELSIHPLIADYARWHLKNAQDLLPPLAQAINEVAGEAINVGNVTLLAALAPHLEVVAESAQEAGLERAGVLWDNLGVCRSRTGDLAGAQAAYERGLALSQSALGPDHPIVVGHLVNLGSTLAARDDPDRAESILERALAIGEGLGTLEINLAIDLAFNLVQLARRREDTAGAEAAIRRVLPLLPADHPKSDEIRRRLGALVEGGGKIDEAQ